MDRRGNIYLTGEAQSGGSLQFYTARFRPDGAMVWLADSQSQCGSAAVSIALGMFDSTIVAGYGCYQRLVNDSLIADFDIKIVQYSRSGDELWFRTLHGANESDDRASAIVSDQAGNVYMVGTSQRGFLTAKYGPSGLKQWEDRFWCSARNKAFDVAIDADRNIFVTGTGCGNVVTISYNFFGVRRWIKQKDLGTDNDSVSGIAVDTTGNAYVVGSGHGTSSDFVLTKYNSFGDEEWAMLYNGPGDDFNLSIAIAVDQDGDIYVTGISGFTNGSFSIVTIKYDPSGNEQWVARYPDQ